MTKKIIAVILTAILLLLAVGCSNSAPKSTTIKEALIKDGTFVNDWADLKFSIPDTYTVLTTEQMKEMAETSDDEEKSDQAVKGDEILYNSRSEQAKEYEIKDLKMFYDINMYTENGTSITIMYESLTGFEGGSNMKVEKYYEMSAARSAILSGLSYTLLGTSTQTIAGHEYYMGSVRFKENNTYQNYYVRKQDGVMICIVITFNDDSSSEVRNFINTIESAH